MKVKAPKGYHWMKQAKGGQPKRAMYKHGGYTSAMDVQKPN